MERHYDWRSLPQFQPGIFVNHVVGYKTAAINGRLERYTGAHSPPVDIAA